MPNDAARSRRIGEKHVVLLGLISEGPIHAYGLEDKIRTRHMAEWADISFSSIYRVLAQLEQMGLIDTQLEHVGQGATRKVHRINEAGMRALAQGVLEQMRAVRPLRNPFMVGLAWFDHVPQAQAVAALRARVTQVQTWLDQIAQAEHQHRGKGADVPTLLFDYIRRHLQADLDFLTQVLDQLQVAGHECSGHASDPHDPAVQVST